MSTRERLSRRDFVRTAAAATAVMAWPAGAQPAPIRIGLVGCGGRGTGAADNCIASSPSVELTAMADLFPDRLQRSRQYLAKRPGYKATDERCFVGFDAYEKLLATDVDLVILATPPGFRPLHFEAAIAAGKHVFMEKPVAVDPVGVRRVLAAGEQAAQKGLAVVAGTQRRHQQGYLETIKRIHDGAIGEIVAARCYWNQAGLWHKERQEGQSDMAWQCRNWLYFGWLSGDHIVEQHVHNLDVCNWVLGGHPVKATGVGGRLVRTDPVYGNIYDHFAIDFEYENGVHVMSMCRQQKGADGRVGEAIVGTKGRADPARWIDGATKWKFEGKQVNPYVQEHRDLIASIRAGEPLNEARQIAESCLTAILGREAAYTGKTLTWDQMMESELDLSPPKYEFGDLAIRPVPKPGLAR